MSSPREPGPGVLSQTKVRKILDTTPDLAASFRPTVFAHACKLCREGIVSKRKDSAYRSGQDRIMIYGPKTDRTYIIEFRMADASRWYRVPAGEARD